ARKLTRIISISESALSLTLEALEIEMIRDSWRADVPWSNQLQADPTHLIYRGPEGAAEDDLELIGTANVVTDGFTFLDRGPLDVNTTYCYRVMTRGWYGNANIDSPLEN